MPSCLRRLVPRHSPSWIRAAGIFQKKSSWQPNSLIKQGVLFYSLELTYSTRCFDQAGGQPLATYQFYKRVLGWTLSGRTPATSTQNDPKHTFVLREDMSGAEIKQLMRSGTHGATHRLNRATSL